MKRSSLCCLLVLAAMPSLAAQIPPHLAAGDYFTLLRKADGTVLAFGHNAYGQLGLGDFTQRATPTPVPALQGACRVAAGGSHALALMTDGTVLSWGANNFGQLGYSSGFQGPSVSVPALIPGLTGVVGIACGRDFSLALAVNNGVTSVWGWGYNSGVLGLGTTAAVGTPTMITAMNGASPVVAIDAGRFTSYFLKADGTLWASGSNMYGQLGIGSTASNMLPVQVQASGTITSIASGDFHCFAVDSSRHAWCWGQNTNYALGIGSSTNVLTPVVHPGLADVVSVAAGQTHTLALLQSGAVRCMGTGSSGQLGIGSTGTLANPGTVGFIAATQAVFAGVEQSFVIQVNGMVKAFGRNNVGQLGMGSTSAVSSTPATIHQLCALNSPVSLTLGPFGVANVQMTISCNWTSVNAQAPLVYFNAFTVNPLNSASPGSGWWFGLHIDAPELLGWVDLAAAGYPMAFGSMNTWGAAATFPVAPATLAGITIHGVTVLVDPLSAASIVEHSPVMSMTF